MVAGFAEVTESEATLVAEAGFEPATFRCVLPLEFPELLASTTPLFVRFWGRR